MSWGQLLIMSVRLLFKTFELGEVVIILDDTGKKRSKGSKQIPWVHHFRNPEGKGTMRGQEVVFLAVVTPKVSFLADYQFYQPDPEYTAWSKETRLLKKRGMKSESKKPQPNPEYPNKQQIGLELLERFKKNYPQIKVKVILADNLYGSGAFMDQASSMFESVQVISQLRKNQKVSDRRREWRLDEYTRAYPGTEKTVCIRGGTTREMTVSSARLQVKAHDALRFVVATRFDEQAGYRYLVASDPCWRAEDIIRAYTLRWLVETAIEDLKVYEGWGRSTKQPGVEGSRRVLILSLLCDHALLLHPQQSACVAANNPLFTIGSLQRHLKATAFTDWLQRWLFSAELNPENLKSQLASLVNLLSELFPLQLSAKHMNGRHLGRLESTPPLKYHLLRFCAPS